MHGMQEALSKAGLEVKDFPAAVDRVEEQIEQQPNTEAVSQDAEPAAPSSSPKKNKDPRRTPDNRGDRRTEEGKGAKPAFKGKPRGPLIIAMATVERGNRQGEIVFRGCFVPGTSADGEARARVVAPNRDCPAWFINECRKIADDFSDKQVRIKVSHTIGNGIAFANPAADSFEQLEEEWTRQSRDLDNFPKTLDTCPGLATGVELIFREAVKVFSTKNDKLELLKLVVRSQADGGSYAILGIKRNGQIFKFTKAEDVWALRDQIASGEVTLANTIRNLVVGDKIRDLADLS